ncbi:MAG TPA: cytochrome c peroxidase, partial [Polyangiaceae bacterium]|nr:cytochrome c peroxidase [Polyangiaceae bacterium]
MRTESRLSPSRIGARILLGVIGIAAIGACRDKEAPFGAGGPKDKSGEAGGSKSTSPISASASEPSADASAFYAERFSRKPSVAAMTELGRRLFFDPELSASHKMACATCHDPHFAYGPPDGRSTQPGGADLRSPGLRAVPSLRYVQNVPPFSEHHFEEGVDESVDQGPTGGHTWDGRVDSTHDQARLPLTSPFEMANESMEAVASKVARSAYAGQFRDTFGDDVFSDPGRASAAILLTLEVFQQSPQDFYPYSSRYDAWLRRQIELT